MSHGPRQRVQGMRGRIVAIHTLRLRPPCVFVVGRWDDNEVINRMLQARVQYIRGVRGQVVTTEQSFAVGSSGARGSATLQYDW